MGQKGPFFSPREAKRGKTDRFAKNAPLRGETGPKRSFSRAGTHGSMDGFDDPKVQQAACPIAQGQTGGVKGALRVAEEAGDTSIAGRRIGPLKFLEELENGQQL